MGPFSITYLICLHSQHFKFFKHLSDYTCLLYVREQVVACTFTKIYYLTQQYQRLLIYEAPAVCRCRDVHFSNVISTKNSVKRIYVRLTKRIHTHARVRSYFYTNTPTPTRTSIHSGKSEHWLYLSVFIVSRLTRDRLINIFGSDNFNHIGQLIAQYKITPINFFWQIIQINMTGLVG